ncbi:FAD-binding oxidoreductase [Micromonospora craniellae]|uniref:FAD-binding oxidoreductase n=1 Tax=Micromonospora craniellae TaxID=2294034 RepID=UPI0018F1AB2B|nr:FAD-binding protein [Micromonospora craniellae]
MTSGDLRYEALCRAYNYRFIAKPDHFVLARTTQDVEAAVQAAVTAGRRVTVRSGGHCGEDFVAAPDVDVIVDLSAMSGISFDHDFGAFAIGAGATVGQITRELFHRWGVTVPCGFCLGVGAGGHISGGGYGPLSRRLGLSVDYLHAVEVVVVAADGTVSTVLATRDDDDPNRDLWWAHTGGGGGNFGVVTRFFLRSPDATGTDPADLLPRPPGVLHIAEVNWPWAELTEVDFVRLTGNFVRWQLANSAPDSADIDIYALLNCVHRAAGDVAMHAHVPDEAVGSYDRLTTFLDAVSDGVGVPAVVRRRSLPWMAATRYLAVPETGPFAVGLRCKVKSADLRGAHTDEQLATAYRHLTSEDHQTTYSALEYIAYGGRVNSVPSTATAVTREAVLRTFYITLWHDPADDDRHLRWIRKLYRDVHATTGGVPVPDATNTGAYINYADIDLADPLWNTSAVAWHTLYYGSNYSRLRAVKARWDPRDVFHHRLSVTPER